MSRKSIVLTALSAVVAAWLASQAFAQPAAPNSHATWKEVFTQAPEMARFVDEVVIATAGQTAPGRIAYSDDPADFVVFENVSFTVDRAYKGDLAEGQNFTLERVADNTSGTDGGPFVSGESYALFIRRQAASEFYLQINDQGRFSISDAQRLVAVSPQDSVAQVFHGRTVEEFDRMVRQYLGG